MKFTEEQFNKLVELQEKYFSNNVLDPADGGGSLQETIRSHDRGLHDFIVYRVLENQAVALMNPATREWAHEQFVEKEKRNVWRLKDKPEFVISKSGGAFFLDPAPSGKTYFTETEIENSPFKPDWFNKEEVK